MDTYPQMQKDIEKLETFVRILRFKPNPGIFSDDYYFKYSPSVDIEEDGIVKQELHSLTNYTINVIFS